MTSQLLLRAPRRSSLLLTVPKLCGAGAAAAVPPSFTTDTRASGEQNRPGGGDPGDGPKRAGGFGSGWKGALLMLPSAVAGCLGVWQVQRKQWKEDLIAERQAQLKEAPVDLFGLDRGPSEYLPVKTSGEFQHDASVFVGPRVKSDKGTAVPGYVVITPLYSKQWQKHILVNRGWVPEAWRRSPESQTPTGTVEVSGVIRHSEAPNSFVPDNEPAKHNWFWIDAPSIAEACHLAADTPLMEVFDSSQGIATKSAPAPTPMDLLSRRSGRSEQETHATTYPLSKGIGDLVDLPVMPGDHLHYAVIWFSLSLVTAGMALQVLRSPASISKLK